MNNTKAIVLRAFIVCLAILTLGIQTALAQRKVTGTVFRDGKPAAGVEVTVHKSKSSYFTSFDGVYEVEVGNKSKYITFAFPDIAERLDIEHNTDDVINYYLGGKADNVIADDKGSKVDTRNQAQLIKDKERDYMSNYSIYDQFYKQKDYKSALSSWSFIYEKYPKSSENVYIHGIKIYDELILSPSSSATEKEEYLNKLMDIYDKRIEYFGREGYNLGRKATSYLKHKFGDQEALTDKQKEKIYKNCYGWLEAALEKGKNDTEAAVLLQLMQATRFLFSVGDFNADKVFNIYEKASDVIEAKLAEDSNNGTYKDVQSALNSTFENSGAADCKDLLRLYGAKFDEAPNDVNLLKKMLRMLIREDCTDSKLYANAAENLYRLEPSAGAARSMARLFLRRNDTGKAIEYYEEAIREEKDNIEKATYIYELASLVFTQRSYSKARNLARRAIRLDEKSGKPYILIGSIYAAAAKDVEGSEFEQNMVYCLAVDYFTKAKGVDPELALEADKEISTYRRYFPNRENAFFEGYSNGDSYTIGGWINEATKVRVR